METIVLALLVLGASREVGAAEPAETAPVPFRICFSRSTTGDIAYNDAVAALSTWGQVVVEDSSVPLDLKVEVTERAAEMAGAFDAGRLEAISMSAEEFLLLRSRPESVLVMERGKSVHTRYVLLVRCDAGWTVPQVLAGKPIGLHRTASTALAPVWLKGLAGQGGQPAPALVDVPAASKAILRVFFKQSDACVATEDAFRLACELNPQLGRALKVLETSPPLMPTAVVIHAQVRDEIRESIHRRVTTLDDSSRGRQMLMVFQADRVRLLPFSEWSPTLDLVQQWLKVGDGASALTTSTGGLPLAEGSAP